MSASGVPPGDVDPDPRDPGRPAVTIAVVTRDRADVLERFLAPSLRTLSPDEAEVLIVDQSTGDATRRLAQSLPGVRWQPGLPPLSRGRNAAVSAARTPLIAFIDDDVELPAGWPARLVAAFARAPRAGAVCGRGLDSRGRLLPGRHAGTYRRPTSPFGLGHGFNMSFRIAALREAGPFDDRLGAGARFPAAEDSDMLHRLMQAGWEVLCDDTITLHHHDWRTPGEVIDLHRAYGIGMGAQTAKHLRRGDVLAGGIAVVEVGRHLHWLLRALAARRRDSLHLQRAWLGGAFWGLRAGLRDRL